MILISLIGEQPIPNLLPLWQSSDYSATRFVVSDMTYRVGEQLAQVLEKEPSFRHLELHAPVHVDAYDLAKTRTRLRDAMIAYQFENNPVCLNLTGGTKLMSLAGMLAAQEIGAEMIYVSTQTGQIIHFFSDGREKERCNIQVKISIEQYFRAHGLRISEHPNFNDLAGKPISPPKEGDELENRVEKLARDSGFFDDVRRNLYVARADGSLIVKNELDILVIRNGRLAVCSCKSGKVENDVLYELNAFSRRESAGTYCGKVLVLGQEPSSTLRKRANESNVRLVFGSKIDDVSEALKMAVS